MPGSNGNTNMQRWNAMARPPATALKQIKGGRLQGMTDVNPQWRYQAMTEQYGPCGEGWRYTIDKLWTEPGVDGEVLGFAQVSLYTRRSIGDNGSYRESEAIIGIGGNHLVVKETKGLRANDECWKMAVTDALSVAMKMLGVAADIYAGMWDGSKYREDAPTVQDGYEQWLTDLSALAESGVGVDMVTRTVVASLPEYKNRLRADKATWKALEAKASKCEAVPA